MLAAQPSDSRIAEPAVRETRDILARELFGHYDVTSLELLGIEELGRNVGLKHDYGLAKATLAFSAKRNESRHPNLNPRLFDPGNAACAGWLYLHCGVPAGHVFEGKLEVVMAVDRQGRWSAVSPNWRSRRQYSLHGYLVLEGRRKEGYVVFPQEAHR